MGRLNRSFGDQPYRVNEQYAWTGGRSVHQPRGRYDHEAESSSRQGSTRYLNPSYRPQYDQRTPSPRRGSPPRPYYNTRQPPVPSRFNSQVNQEWRRVSPNQGRRDTGGSHQEQSATPTSACTRQEYQVHPQQVVQHPINVHPQVMPSSSSQHHPPVLLTQAVPPTATSVPSANKRKHENRRNNRRAMYEELQELVLSNVHVRVQPEGQVHPFYDKITLPLDPTLKEQ
jgi:hypothetical protein